MCVRIAACHSTKHCDQAARGRSGEVPNLLELSVHAARARCTVGEISAALEEVWGRYKPSDTLVLPLLLLLLHEEVDSEEKEEG